MHSFLIVSPSENSRNKRAFEMANQALVIKTDAPANHPDLMIIHKEDKASIGIEKIRHLITWLSLKPFQSKIKVVLIQDAQNLTPESQNALLKTLEEPPGHCRIILTAPHKSSLIPTVISRCAVIDLGSERGVMENPETELQKLKIEDLIKMTIGQRLDYSEEKKETFSNREQTLIVVDGWLVGLSDLIKTENPNGSNNIYQVSQDLFELKKDLTTTNVSPRNLIDLFFLKI